MIKGVGDISFELSFSATDQDGNPSVTAPVNVADPNTARPSWVPKYGPYRTYFRLRYGDVAIIAGVITNTSSTKGSDFMTLTGKTWEHFLEKWIYPDDARMAWSLANLYVFPNSFTGNEIGLGLGHATPSSLVYEAANRDVIYILSDIFSETMNLPYRVIFDISTLAGLSGVKSLYFTYNWGDTSTINGLFDTLSSIYPGFDWWISQDMKIMWSSPYRFGSPDAPYLFDNIADATPGIDIAFNNNGPVATHVLASGSGLATPQVLRRGMGSPSNESFYSRFDTAVDVGDVRNIDEMNAKTQHELVVDVQPQHEIPLTMYPAQYSPDERTYWANYRVGRAIGMTMDFFYHKVIEPQQLVSYQASLSNEGEAVVNWTLQQIYKYSTTAGVFEG
jgi:hypothetical protein